MSWQPYRSSPLGAVEDAASDSALALIHKSRSQRPDPLEGKPFD